MLRCYSIHTVNIQKTERNHVVHLICVCEHVCAQVCIFWSVGQHCEVLVRPSHSHTFNGLNCPHLLMLMFLLWFYFIFFPSTFCVCEDANVTHKVSIVKKKQKNIVGFVCKLSLSYLLLSPYVTENRQHSKLVFEVKLGVMCKWRRTVIVVKLENH